MAQRPDYSRTNAVIRGGRATAPQLRLIRKLQAELGLPGQVKVDTFTDASRTISALLDAKRRP
jgi:hypothetical protein